MTGRPEIARQKQRLEATFKRASGLKDAELLADFAKYLCVLVAGFLEQAIIEIALEHARTHSHASVQRHVEKPLRRFTSASSQRITELLGSFDADWQKDLESYLIDEYKDAVNSVVNLRHTIAHGRHTGVTMAGVQKYFDRVKVVVDHCTDLCIPK